MNVLVTEELKQSIAEGFAFPSRWYTDPAVFEREQDRILRRGWHYVTHVGTLAEVGDQFVWQIAGVPIVLVRATGADGDIRGYVNICRHRAHPVVEASGNRRTMQCGYHAWTYELDGSLKHAPRSDADPTFDPSSICLPGVQVHVWGPMVWANLDGDAPPFPVYAAGLDEHLVERGCLVSDYVHAFEHTWEIAANWKVFQDNTIECYHCPTTHPELSRALVMNPDKQVLDVGGRYWIHHTIPFRDGVPEGISWGPVEGRPYNYHYQYVFPATYLQNSGRGFDIGSVEAVAVDRIRFRHACFLSPERAEQYRDLGAETLAADPTIRQDVGICNRVQAAHSAGVAPPGRLLAGAETLLQHFNRLIVELLE